MKLAIYERVMKGPGKGPRGLKEYGSLRVVFTDPVEECTRLTGHGECFD